MAMTSDKSAQSLKTMKLLSIDQDSNKMHVLKSNWISIKSHVNLMRFPHGKDMKIYKVEVWYKTEKEATQSARKLYEQIQ